jgi:hypothetical protein
MVNCMTVYEPSTSSLVVRIPKWTRKEVKVVVKHPLAIYIHAETPATRHTELRIFSFNFFGVWRVSLVPLFLRDNPTAC